MNDLSDYRNSVSSDDEINAILADIKGMRESAAEKKESAPSKMWSMSDIDRLIAQTNGEEYVPSKPEKATPAEDFEKLLNADMFRVKSSSSAPAKPAAPAAPKPVEKPKPVSTPVPAAPVKEKPAEMQDISSFTEMDGQEKFDESDTDFDAELLEIETVIMPEDAPKEPDSLFSGLLSSYGIEKAPDKSGHAAEKPAQIRDFSNITESPAEIFKRKTDEAPVSVEETHIDESQYRTRFFTKLRLDNTDEIDIEPEFPIDKSGIVVDRPEHTAENGLDPMPTVLDADKAKEIDDEKTRIMGEAAAAAKPDTPPSNDVEGQITLSGFDEIPEETLPEKASERDIEENLWERRRQKAKNFKLSDDLNLDEDFEVSYTPSPEEIAKEEKARKKEARLRAIENLEEKSRPNMEYNSPDERPDIHIRLVSKAEKATKKFFIAAGIELLVIIINLLPALTEGLSIESAAFSKGSVIFYIINALLIICAAAYDSNHFLGGFLSLLKGKITADTAVSLSLTAALIQCTSAAVFGSGENIPVFSAAAVFGIVASKAADMLNAKRILGNFEVCAFKYEHNMYAVHPLENEAEIFELGRGLMMGNADLLYSSKLAFPSDFMKNSDPGKGETKLVKYSVPGAGAAALAVAVIAGIFTKSVLTAVSAFAGTFCICAPVLTMFIPALMLRFADKGLNKAGSAIISLEQAEKISGANAVVMDSADIFSHSDCIMHGMKDFKNIRIDDVLLYAAALVIKSGGPLRECFEQVVNGKPDILPPVKELNYEDKLGISARIHNQKVLLGNRNLLIHHNIDVPDKAMEDKYSHSGRKVIYLAVAEKMAAMFVVSYAVDKELDPYLKTLESSGIQVLVRTTDVNVTEELISGSFGMPQENFRVLSAVAGKLFKRRRDAVSDRLPAGIVHDGKAKSMLRSVAASCNMSSALRLNNVIQIILSVLGFILGAALFCTQNAELFTGITAFLFLIAGTLISSVIALFGKS